MEVYDRVKLLLNKAGMSQRDFANKLSISAPRLNNYLSGRHNIPHELLIKMSELTNSELSWLLTGSGSMFIAKDTPNTALVKALEDQSAQLVELKKGESVKVPIVGSIAAGPPLEIVDIDRMEYVVLDRSIAHFPGEYICFRVEGDSMYPEIKNDDVVLIHTRYDYSLLHQSIVAVSINGENTLKYMHVDHTHRQSILYPVNARKHKSIIIDEDTVDSITIIGQMVMLFRKYV